MYNACMGKHRKNNKTRRDVAEIALSVVEHVTGEKLSGGQSRLNSKSKPKPPVIKRPSP